MRKRTRGFSLMEASAGLSLLALFIAVFISLSSRLASAQSQQANRAAALGHLLDGIEQVKQEGPARWHLPYKQEIAERGTVFQVEVVENVGMVVPDRSFGGLRATVRWGSVTGEQTLEREVWVHEHLQ